MLACLKLELDSANESILVPSSSGMSITQMIDSSTLSSILSLETRRFDTVSYKDWQILDLTIRCIRHQMLRLLERINTQDLEL
jgi:hypothetical protein